MNEIPDLLRRLELVERWVESLRMATSREAVWLVANDEQTKQAYEVIREARTRIATVEAQRDGFMEVLRKTRLREAEVNTKEAR